MAARVSPFLKWVGGKSSVLTGLDFSIASEWRKHSEPAYVEPFVGGGALFFYLTERVPLKTAILGDSCEPLMRTYQAVRDIPGRVLSELEILASEDITQEAFERLRGTYSVASSSPASLAAWFIYVNRMGFNGLWRVNSKGICNVPYGKPARNPFTASLFGRISACAGALSEIPAALVCADFAAVCNMAVQEEKLRGSLADPSRFLFFFDPPYWPRKATGFDSYSAVGFGPKDHERLCDLAAQLKQWGAKVLLMNSNVEAVKKLYASRGFEMAEMERYEGISCKSPGRDSVSDLVIW